MHRRACLIALASAAFAARRARAAAPTVQAVEVGPGAYVLPGSGGAVDAGNLGRIGNAGFIVGHDGVLAIDTGVSRLHGEALLAAIETVSALTVRRVLVTHARQEFLFGAGAYQARGIPVHMQREAAELMAARCENCLETLRRELGEDVMRGTTMFEPDHVFDVSYVDQTIGRPVLVQHHGHSSGPGAISIFDVRSRTLFAGGLLDARRVPDIQDADLAGWHQALAALRLLRIDTIVPGHGPSSPPELIDSVELYLRRLERRVDALFKAGTALSAVADAAALPEYEHWDQYDVIHRRNASVLFLRLERRAMRDAPDTRR